MKNITVHRFQRFYENDIYYAKLNGGGVSKLFVCSPFNYIPSKNAS